MKMLRKNSFSFHRKTLCMYICTYVYNLLRESLLRLHVELQEEENLMVPKICNMGAGIIYVPFQVVLINHSYCPLKYSTVHDIRRTGTLWQRNPNIDDRRSNEKILKSQAS